jgi:uncharacterized protein (DUF1778 family)
MPALIAAAATVVNGTVNSLMQNKMYKAQADNIQLQGRLSQLDSAQQYALAVRLQQAKNDNERFSILQNSISRIDEATVGANAGILQASIQARAKETQTTAIIIGSSVILLIGSYYVLYKK